MSLSIGIVGLPNVGKSTLFNALTGNEALSANYPFATIEPNTGIVPIPDPRLNVLAELYNAQKVIPATVTFVDIAGLVAGASQGEGLGNQFLANIRECSAICHVVRAFHDDNVIHVDNDHNPQKDIDVINTELILADIQTVQKRLPAAEKNARSDPKLAPVAQNYKKALELLNNGQMLNNSTEIKLELLADLHLLTTKPTIYVFNVDEESLKEKDKLSKLEELVSPSKAIFICAKIEEELKNLDDADRIELLESYGISESGLRQLIDTSYDILGLQSYLTAGEKEVRAWTIKKGFTAPQAAGVIHTDFERGFIAASIVSFQDLVEAGTESQARSNGKMRTEGKTYIMQPDDIVEFRFNV